MFSFAPPALTPLSLAKRYTEFLHAVVTARATPPQFATPNHEVLDLPTVRLLHFPPAPGDAVQPDTIPTIIDAPYAGHCATIADFLPYQSLVRTLLKHNHGPVYVTDWKSATLDMRDYNIDVYLRDLNACAEAVMGHQGKVNLVGLCQGGWLSAMLAALYPDKVNALVLAGSPLHTQAGDGYLKKMVNHTDMSIFQSLVMAGGGLMRGRLMLMGWKQMNRHHHFFEKYRVFYDHLDHPDPRFAEKNKAFESWYETTVDLPGAFYLQVVQELFKDNSLARGEFVGLQQKLSFKNIHCPVYLMAGSTDDITTPEQVFEAAPLFGTNPAKIEKALVPGGHIGLFMGSNTLNKYWPRVGEWLNAA